MKKSTKSLLILAGVGGLAYFLYTRSSAAGTTTVPVVVPPGTVPVVVPAPAVPAVAAAVQGLGYYNYR